MRRPPSARAVGVPLRAPRRAAPSWLREYSNASTRPSARGTPRLLFVHPRLESETRHAGAKERVNRKATDTRRRGHTPPARQRLLTARWARRFRSPTIPRPPRARAARRRRAPRGGQLYKFEGEAYALFHPNVTPELFDDGDDESPQWILDVRVRLTVRGARAECPCSSRARGARSRGGAPRARRAPRPSRRACASSPRVWAPAKVSADD